MIEKVKTIIQIIADCMRMRTDKARVYPRLSAFYLHISALTFLLVVFLTAIPVYADLVDKIAIVVNNEVITLSEIDQMLIPVYARYKMVYKNQGELAKKMEEARQKIIEQLIEDKLIVSEAKKQNVEIDDKEVDAKLREVEKQFGSKNAFTRALMEQHLSVKDLRTRYREQMMSRRMIDRKIGSSIIVSPVEVDAYYNEHRADFVQPSEIKLSNILIRVKDDADTGRARELAQEIARRIKNGDDFVMLAQEYSEGPGASEGGVMRPVKKGDLMPELEAAVFSLKAGEVSEVIKSPMGFHIFKADDVKEGRTLPISEVYKEIEELIFRDKVKVKIKGWLDTLRKNAYIAFK